MGVICKRPVVDGDPLLFREVFVEVEPPVSLFRAHVDRRVDVDVDRHFPILEGEGVDREVVQARPFDRHDLRWDGFRVEEAAQTPCPEDHGDEDREDLPLHGIRDGWLAIMALHSTCTP